ncbi:hypothetical protein [Lacrimispora sp.]|uniref:hypothetical protein n=1 Tax=Lacrimispora sp. TaxID=2719234 RepID=UPI00345F265B
MDANNTGKLFAALIFVASWFPQLLVFYYIPPCGPSAIVRLQTFGNPNNISAGQILQCIPCRILRNCPDFPGAGMVQTFYIAYLSQPLQSPDIAGIF